MFLLSVPSATYTLSDVKEFRETIEASQVPQHPEVSFLFLQETHLPKEDFFLLDFVSSHERIRIKRAIANITSNNIANVLLFIFNNIKLLFFFIKNSKDT
jgi:hypothetical protein